MSHALLTKAAAAITLALMLAATTVGLTGCGDGPPRPGGRQVIDLQTGEVFYLERTGRGGFFFPVENPETGVRSLVPLDRPETMIDGESAWDTTRWVVQGRYLADLQFDPETLTDKIDPDTGEYTGEVPGSPQRIKVEN